MKDLAFEWIQTYIAAVGTDTEDPLTKNYSVFCDALKKMFGDVTLVSDAENTVMLICQKSNDYKFRNNYKNPTSNIKIQHDEMTFSS